MIETGLPTTPKSTFPEAMIEEQIDSMLRDMEMRMMYQGMRLDDYSQVHRPDSRSSLREMYTASR